MMSCDQFFSVFTPTNFIHYLRSQSFRKENPQENLRLSLIGAGTAAEFFAKSNQ